MRKITFPCGDELRLYDSIDDTPVSVWNAYQSYMCLAGAGSTIPEIEQNIALLAKFHEDKDDKSFNMALNNVAQGLSFFKGGFHPKFFAFTILSKSLKGIDHGSVQEHLQEILAMQPLNSEIDAVLKDYNHDIQQELSIRFPEIANGDNSNRTFLSAIKNKGLAYLDMAIFGEDKSGTIKALNFTINQSLAPNNANPHDSQSVFNQNKRAAMDMELQVEKEFGVDPTRTLAKLYTIIAAKMKQQTEQMSQQNKR